MKLFTKCAALIAFATVASYAQNTFPTGAGTNVGIGTTSPANRLQVTSAAANTSGVRLTNLTSSSTATVSNGKSLSVNNSGDIILSPSNVETSLFAISTATTATSGADYMQKAHVFGAGYATAFPSWGISRYGFNVFDLYNYGTHPYDEILLNAVDRSGKERLYFNGASGSGAQTTFGIRNHSDVEVFKISDELAGSGGSIYFHMPQPNSRLVIGSNGVYATPHKLVVAGGSALVEGNVITNANLGVGTSSFTDGADTYRVSIDGALRADRVRVYTTWADYVFENDYKLPTLEEVEQHIFEKGHLKDIPSACEVEEKGIELGEMNKLLLQKVEELTLYVIELNREIKNLKATKE